MAQKLYATVKESSKYFHQNEFAKANPAAYGGFPFEVSVYPDMGEYAVQGGPGGQYRLQDVWLYVIENGRQIRLN